MWGPKSANLNERWSFNIVFKYWVTTRQMSDILFTKFTHNALMKIDLNIVNYVKWRLKCHPYPQSAWFMSPLSYSDPPGPIRRSDTNQTLQQILVQTLLLGYTFILIRLKKKKKKGYQCCCCWVQCCLEVSFGYYVIVFTCRWGDLYYSTPHSKKKRIGQKSLGKSWAHEIIPMFVLLLLFLFV